ncbi:MAG TPA: nitronate monooxygenase [Anaeromyxobacteraceae bacterium]|nr:nitronate monooxygenase [Anaeromyxobacteraceae bacterium]
MWSRNALTRRLGIEWPVLQAPMAGGVSTPAMAAAVSEAGGLGAFAVGTLPPEAVRDGVRAVRARTARPFAVNVFVPSGWPAPPEGPLLDAAVEAVRPFREEHGLGPPAAPGPMPRLEEQLEAALDAGFPVLSFVFGIPPSPLLERVRRAGIVVIGTATTPAEAAAIEAAGCDAVIAQGAEAGGHRGGSPAPGGAPALVGTLALVPRVVDRVRIPVIAAGGIADGRGLAAALALGASAVQCGSAFLACAESGASPAYRDAVAAVDDGDRTALTRAFSGGLARGVRNRFVSGMAGQPVLPFPYQNGLTQDLRAAAARSGDAGLLSMWVGQGPSPRRDVGAGEVVAGLVREAAAVLDALR